jgi:hypothetical protein
MAGRKVELIVEDSQSRPDVAVTKLRKLVEHDRVHLVAGVLFGAISATPWPRRSRSTASRRSSRSPPPTTSPSA